jgi:hypothetical protein
MGMNIARELALLKRMTTKELQTKFALVFGEATRAGNRSWLVKRIAWRLQAAAEGDLTERARQRATELANDNDLRLNPPKQKDPEPTDDRVRIVSVPLNGGSRLPPPGTVLVREYKGVEYHVTILNDGFEIDGQRYKSLSAVARAISGQHCNGYQFFKLTKGVAS